MAVDRYRMALESAQEQHDEYVRLLQEAQEAETASEEVARKLGIARAMEAREELDELSARLAEAEQIKAELPPERPPEAHRLTAEAEALRDALSAFKERPGSAPLPEGRSAAAIEAELEGLPERPAGDTEFHELVTEALDRLKDRRSAVETARTDPAAEPQTADLKGTTPAELRRLAEDLDIEVPEVDPTLVEQLQKARAAEARPRVGPVGVALIASGGIAVGAGLAVIGLLLLVVPVLRREKPPVSTAELQTRVTYQQEAQRQAEAKRQRAEDRARELGLGTDPAELRRLARSAEDAEADRERYAKWHSRLEGLELDLERAEGALRAAVEAAERELIRPLLIGPASKIRGVASSAAPSIIPAVR